MKTDRERFKEFLTLANVGYDEADRSVKLSVKWDKKFAKVDGYTGFYTEFTFDEAGALVGVGIWE